MDYTEAVRLARTGDERGFGYLYENTYKSKYYLALQYMKNKDAAEDVLQDAYIKAFSKLDTLEEPERFPTWLGQIVANTAKNALAKKSPLLFTDVAAETEMEDFVDMIEDDDITAQPELSYTREETRTLVRELIDALSEEQRICILLFHIEGVSIKEIAQTLGCSENTVKSRLNYGRKNLKMKAEELQKKGYKLYGIAPLPLLLLLLRADWHSMLAEGSIQAGGHSIAEHVFARIPAGHPASGNAQAGPDAARGEKGSAGVQSGKGSGRIPADAASGLGQTGAGTAAKTVFLHTVAGKAAVVVLGLCLAGGVIYGIRQNAGNGRVPVEANRDVQSQMEPATEREAQVEPENQAGAESEVENQAGTVLESEVENQAGTVPESEVENQAGTVPESEREHQAGTEPESESKHQAEPEPESESEHQAEPESVSDPVNRPESEVGIRTETIAGSEPEESMQAPAVADADYPDLLEGNLTKKELEFILAYGPETLTEQGLSGDDYLNILNCWCQASKVAGGFITFVGTDANYRQGYSVADINRYLSSFTDYRFTEDNDTDTPYGLDVDGDTIWFTPAELSFEAQTTITDTACTEDTMTIRYTYEKNSYENGLMTSNKIAVLKKTAEGKYRIITIAEDSGAAEETGIKIVREDTNGMPAVQNGSDTSVRAIYEAVLRSVQNQEAGYEFQNAGGSTDFQYFLWDMNGDGIKELIVGAMFMADVFDAYDIRVFTVSQDASGYIPKAVEGDIVSLALYLPADGSGLYTMDMNRGTGRTDIYRITIEGDTLTMGGSPELTYTMGDSAGTQFINSNSYAEWMSASSLDGLSELE